MYLSAARTYDLTVLAKLRDISVKHYSLARRILFCIFGGMLNPHSARSIPAHEPIGTAIVCTISALSHAPVRAVGIRQTAPVRLL